MLVVQNGVGHGERSKVPSCFDFCALSSDVVDSFSHIAAVKCDSIRDFERERIGIKLYQAFLFSLQVVLRFDDISRSIDARKEITNNVPTPPGQYGGPSREKCIPSLFFR
jgi:hypothetical protein